MELAPPVQPEVGVSYQIFRMAGFRRMFEEELQVGFRRSLRKRIGWIKEEFQEESQLTSTGASGSVSVDSWRSFSWDLEEFLQVFTEGFQLASRVVPGSVSAGFKREFLEKFQLALESVSSRGVSTSFN